jgi:hypothetical protein
MTYWKKRTQQEDGIQIRGGSHQKNLRVNDKNDKKILLW